MFCLTRIVVNRAQGNSGDVTALVIMEKKKYDEMIERISALENTIEDYEKGQESSNVLETKE